MSVTGELRIPLRYYLRLPELLAGHELGLAALLAELGISPQQLLEPDATLKLSQVEQMVARVFELTQRRDLGFELGQLLSVSSHSFVGFGALNSPTIEQAMMFIARYFRLVMPSFTMRYQRQTDGCEVRFTPTVAMTPLSLAFHLEAIAMATLREVREISDGQLFPCQIDYSIASPPHAARYLALRNVSVKFGVWRMPEARLRFEADLSQYALTTADPNARNAAEARCRALVSRTARSGKFREWVQMTLREVNGTIPSLTELASSLNLSPRTLNRYLEREGTTLRQITGEIQHELACQWLRDGQMSTTDIAMTLGFSDPANFSRAFRAKAGCSPREFLARLRDTDNELV